MQLTNVAWLGAVEIADQVGSGEVQPQTVVEAYLERIRRLDARVHAYVYVDQAARVTGNGLLTGVTLAVKDTQPVNGMPWTYGTPSWRDRIAERDAIPVARARAAGAAILGKVNTPELAAAVGTTNFLFPATENPWRPGFTPGGSSGGSAAAVAAGLACVAFGDDYGGSVRIPASCCGLVGLRPSPGRVPQEVPDPAGLNSRGPITRCVADARLLFQVMAAEVPPPPESRGLRIAVADSNVFGIDPACQAACRRAAEALQAAGHSVETTTWDAAPVAEAYRIVRRVSVASFPGDPESFGAGVRTLIREGREIRAVDFYLAHQRATAAARHLNDLVEKDFDAILTPTLGDPPMPISQVPTFLGQNWDRYTAFVLPVSFSGLPAISVPAGLHDGLPVGVQLIGRFRQEWALLQLAEELEHLDGFGFQRPRGFD